MNKKIKVLQVIGSLRVGGAETVAMNFFRYIDRERFDYDYLVYGEDVGTYESEVEKLGGKVIHINPPNEGYANFFRNVKRVIRENGPYDIVHSHTLFNSGLILKAAYSENVSVRIAHAHSERNKVNYSWVKKKYIAIMKYLIKKYANSWIACSQQAGNYLYGEKFFSENGLIIRNAINSNDYKFKKDKRKFIREKYNLEGKYVIGHVGRFSKVKNHTFILDVFKNIIDKKQDSILLLIGDGEERSSIENKLNSLGISDNVILTGEKTNVYDYMNAMDILFFPSHYEGLGIVVIEAQAMGLKCVVSQAIPKEVNFSGNVKFLSLKDDIEKWSKEILDTSHIDLRQKHLKLPDEYEITCQINILQNLYLNKIS